MMVQVHAECCICLACKNSGCGGGRHDWRNTTPAVARRFTFRGFVVKGRQYQKCQRCDAVKDVPG